MVRSGGGEGHGGSARAGDGTLVRDPRFEQLPAASQHDRKRAAACNPSLLLPQPRGAHRAGSWGHCWRPAGTPAHPAQTWRWRCGWPRAPPPRPCKGWCRPGTGEGRGSGAGANADAAAVQAAQHGAVRCSVCAAKRSGEAASSSPHPPAAQQQQRCTHSARRAPCTAPRCQSPAPRPPPAPPRPAPAGAGWRPPAAAGAPPRPPRCAARSAQSCPPTSGCWRCCCRAGCRCRSAPGGRLGDGNGGGQTCGPEGSGGGRRGSGKRQAAARAVSGSGEQGAPCPRSLRPCTWRDEPRHAYEQHGSGAERDQQGKLGAAHLPLQLPIQVAITPGGHALAGSGALGGREACEAAAAQAAPGGRQRPDAWMRAVPLPASTGSLAGACLHSARCGPDYGFPDLPPTVGESRRRVAPPVGASADRRRTQSPRPAAAAAVDRLPCQPRCMRLLEALLRLLHRAPRFKCGKCV